MRFGPPPPPLKLKDLFSDTVLQVSAARQLVSLQDIRASLATLFSNARSLCAAAGAFSELAWQIQDRDFLRTVTLALKGVQVIQSGT